MPTLCPQCKTPTLDTAQLDADLPTLRCTTCHGHWLTYAHYFSYTNLPEHPATPAATDEAPEPDSPALKLCPACLKFMRYYPVALTLPFGIDICNTCGGIWLNAHEWPALVTHNLHRHLHAIASVSWQADLAAQRRLANERNALLLRLGQNDLAELDRITTWLRDHPQRPTLLAHLFQHLHSPGSDLPSQKRA